MLGSGATATNFLLHDRTIENQKPNLVATTERLAFVDFMAAGEIKIKKFSYNRETVLAISPRTE